jgi:uncharacterized protein YdaU (DUF1376 family)
MAQNREPPAFQEYAAAMMAKTDYRLMSLAGRGLLYTMRLECWVNRRLPPDAPRLARVLGFDVAEVAALIPEVQPFFAIDEEGLFCPELEDYREHVDGRREKLSEAGKRGAAKTNQKHAGDEAATPSATPRPGRGPLVQPSKAKPNSIQVLSEEPISDEWVSQYERETRGH